MKPRPKPSARAFRRIFAVPALLALLNTAGLLTALAGDGAYDVLSWLLLSAPLAVLSWAVTRPALNQTSRRTPYRP